MIILDGSDGEGGGQVVRNACALSLITGEPFRIDNIRGKRPKPGLMRQHVTAVEAACAISGSDCSAFGVGTTGFEFRPGRVIPGDYRFAIGTAGSTALVLQTVLMPLALANGPSRLVLTGGTHTMAAPPFEFVARSLLPVINRMGPRLSARIVRHGFYPRGGGQIEIDIIPAPMTRLDALTRGDCLGVSGRILFAGLPEEITARLASRVRHALPDWPDHALTVHELPPDEGPGLALLLEAQYANVTEIVSAFGQLGISGERLANTSVTRLKGYIGSTAFAGMHLADQVVVPLAVSGGGSMTTVTPSQHTLTAIEITKRFTGQRIDIVAHRDGPHLLTVGTP